MLLVIFNHTGKTGFVLFTVAASSPLYPFYMFISAACKVAVPLYWMVSGALLLTKEESIKDVYAHRVLRMVIVLVLFSGVVYLWQYFTGQVEQLSLIYFLKKLYSDRIIVPYYFLYSYISMLLMLPLLRKMVKNMTRTEFHYMFVLLLTAFGFIPIVQYLLSAGTLSMSSYLTGNLFGTNILYFVAGYYFGTVIDSDELSGKTAAQLIACGFAALVITCLMTQYKINLTGATDESSVQTFYANIVGIPTFAVFYTVRYIFARYSPGEMLRRVICMFGSATFGILLLEGILRVELKFIFTDARSVLPTLPSCILWVASVYLCGAAITLCLKKIPGLKKLL